MHDSIFNITRTTARANEEEYNLNESRIITILMYRYIFFIMGDIKRRSYVQQICYMQTAFSQSLAP